MEKIKGFSLIELCFVIAGLLLVLGTAYLYLGKLQRSDAVQSEVMEFADHYRVADNLLGNDFNDAGHNLTLSGDYVFGGEYPLYFMPNENWEQTDNLRTDGATYRQVGFPDDFLTSNLISRKGTAMITFRFETGNYQIGLRAVEDAGNSRYVVINGNRLTVNEMGENVFNYVVDSSSGEPQKIVIALEYLQGQAGCVTDYYSESGREKNLIYRSSSNCPVYPIEAVATSLESPRSRAEIRNVKISGTDMISREAVARQSFVYPSYKGQEIFSPIIQVRNGSVPASENPFNDVLFFGGSTQSDVYYTRTGFTVGEGGVASLDISQPSNSTMTAPLQENDVVNVIDYGGRQSVLGIVSNVTTDNLTLTALTGDSSYGGFYTLPVNYSQHQFSAGASVVKIAAPVEWQFVNNQLLRRTAGGAWQTVVLGVTAAKIAAVTSNLEYSDGRGGSVIRSYAVNLLIKQDGSETAIDGAAPERAFRAIYTPPAVNRDSNN